MKSLNALGIFLAASSLYAGQDVSSKETKDMTVIESPFDKGQHEFQLSAGSLTSLFHYGPYRPQISDVDVSLRLGWMLNTPEGAGFLRGNWEFMVEAQGSLDYQGPKTGTLGGDLMLRYNFVQPQALLVPYIQLQGGGVYTNIDHDPDQHFIGRDEEFYLGTGIGVRYFVSPRCSISVEADYRHLSNGNTADRNIGLNSVGGMAGFSFFF